MASENSGPGGLPVPDNQGKLKTCTRFAVAKAVIAGFMMKIFVPNEEVDVDQEAVVTALLNEHKDEEAKWPHQFHGKKYQFKDRKLRYWKVDLRVEKLPGLQEFINEITTQPRKGTFVIVYPLDWKKPNGDKHSVYAEDFDNNTGYIHCINSGTNDPKPQIPSWKN